MMWMSYDLVIYLTHYNLRLFISQRFINFTYDFNFRNYVFDSIAILSYTSNFYIIITKIPVSNYLNFQSQF